MQWTADGPDTARAQEHVAVVLRAELVAILCPQMAARVAQAMRSRRVTRRRAQVQLVGVLVPQSVLFLL